MFKSTSSPAFAMGVTIPGTCQECGCTCNSCASYDNSLDLHHEIEELRSKLVKSNGALEQLRSDYEQVRSCCESQVDKLQDEHHKLRDRYDRLLETYKKTQKVNHDLEDKLLKVVQTHEEARRKLETEVARLTSELMDAKYTVNDLEQESERYRNDCFVAVQLLQCKPSTFVAHKLDTLPLDVQQRVKVHMTREEVMQMEDSAHFETTTNEQRMIRVPMPTFPPTAMVYSVNKKMDNSNSFQNGNQRLKSGNGANMDSIPTELIAKVLAPPESKRKPSRYYVCNRCSTEFTRVDMATQTVAMGLQETANGYPRTVVANMRTNPPTITPTQNYPRVHAPKSRGNSFGSDCT